ncbi:hypothetical protein ACQ4LE_000339 [Meloidogyne hapla]|uniref:SPRY domain-containing protein n=1 Tax=Meloidogyne hapla TaxID=6305 RepID=A0A1I8BPN9_MELHA
MTEDKSFDSDYELIQSNNEIKNEGNFKNILISGDEIAKEKVKLIPVYLNIEELKQTFQQMIGEIKTENAMQNSALKEIIEQKDEKIITLVKQIKESNNDKTGELDLEIEKTNNFDYKSLCFVHVENKWKEFYFKYNFYKCCEKECINTENPIGKCIKGNGFANIINDANIEYIEWFKKKGCFGGYDKYSYIFAENSFNKPKEDFNNYSLFYYEIKTKIDEDNKNRHIEIGLKNSEDNYVLLTVNYNIISYNFQKEGDEINIKNIDWNNNDVFGCGLIYPPTNNKISKEFPYIFFTQNGKQIGKAILNDNFDDYKPYIGVTCCSLETNFGKDLEAKPFVYDITKHTQYSDFENDLNELIEIFTSIKKEGIKQILMENEIDKENVLKKLIGIFPKNFN